MNEIINAIQFHSHFPNFHKCNILHCSFKIKSNLIWVHFLTILIGKRTFSVKSGEIETKKFALHASMGRLMQKHQILLDSLIFYEKILSYSLVSNDVAFDSLNSSRALFALSKALSSWKFAISRQVLDLDPSNGSRDDNIY